MHHPWQNFVDALRGLLRCVRRSRHELAVIAFSPDGVYEQPDWGECESLLDCVPAPTDEYAYLKCHLQNARHYFQTGEIGASLYETGLALRRASCLRSLYS